MQHTIKYIENGIERTQLCNANDSRNELYLEFDSICKREGVTKAELGHGDVWSSKWELAQGRPVYKAVEL